MGLMGDRYLTAAVTVFLLSFTGLALEIAFTRIFAVVLRYHFAFLALSVALSGLGLGGYLVHWMLKGWDDQKLLTWCLVGFPVTTLLSLTLLLFWVLPVNPNLFLLPGGACLLPFLCLGGSLSLLLRRWAHWSGRLYGWDLAGAGLAAGAVIVGLNLLGAVNLVIALVGLAFLALTLTAGPLGRVFGCLGLLACLTVAVANDRAPFLDLPLVKKADLRLNKPMLAELADPRQKSKIVFTVWNAFGRTDVVASELSPGLLHAYTDGEVPATLIRLRGGHLKDGLFLMDSLMGIPYALLTFPIRPRERMRRIDRVLSLGAGGGADVVAALIAGARAVDAVEVNPGMKEVADRFREFTGDIFSKPGVRLILAEGRAFTRATGHRYDLIVMALTQTATMGKGGLALVESYIHTREACQDYWRALSDRGMIALITQEPFLALRWLLTCIEVAQQMTGKNQGGASLHTAWWTASEEMGEAGPYRHLVLLSRKPFDDQWLPLLDQVTRRWQANPIFVPGISESWPVAGLTSGAIDSAGIVRDVLWKTGLWVAPVTDDAPFFPDLSPTIPGFLWQFCAAGLGLVLILGVTAGLQLRSTPRQGTSFWIATFYTGLLGVSYLLAEIALLQRTMLVLPSPTHSLALVVAALLMGSALGSRLSQKLDANNLHRFAAIFCFLVAAMSASVSFAIADLSQLLQSQTVPIRVVSLLLISFVMGIPMGIPFPSALRLAGSWAIPIPYLWGVNGVTSVIGSVSAVIIGRTFGYSKGLIVSGSCYFFAGLLMLLWEKVKKGERRA